MNWLLVLLFSNAVAFQPAAGGAGLQIVTVCALQRM
jgi:hypothetical protein